MTQVPLQKRIRRCILDYLYQMFKEYPYAEIELKQIEEECGVKPRDINWNMVYLEKSGFVNLGKSIECPPYIACSASLTALGIDLIEDEEEFNLKFPFSKKPTDSSD